MKRLVIIDVKIKNSKIVDYECLANQIEDFTNGKVFEYIEDVARELKNYLILQLSPDELFLEIKKPNILKNLYHASVIEDYKKNEQE